MGLFDAIDIAGSGLTAERLRMDVTAENLANAQTTRTADGGPYQRKQVVLQPAGDSSFGTVLTGAIGGVRETQAQPRRRGRRDRRGHDLDAARLRPQPSGRRTPRATSRCRTSTPSRRWST